MAIALVSNATVGGPNGGTTAAIDTTGATLLVVHISENADGGVTVSDSKGNSWTGLTAQPANPPVARLWYVANPTVGTGHTFTATGLSTFCTLDVAAFSGVVTVSPFDQQNGGSSPGYTSPAQPGSITPGQDNELIVAGLAFTTGTGTFSIDSGMSITDQTAFNGGVQYAGAMAYVVQGAAAAINPSWTFTGSTNGGLTIASFIAAVPVVGRPRPSVFRF